MAEPERAVNGEKSLEDLALESAKLLIQIRKRLKAEQTDPRAKYYYTYVLLLQNNNIYVGSTNHLYIRLMEHLHNSERSSQWVRLHGPIIRVLEVCKNCKGDDEAYKTLQYMNLFGWQSVRGASWCKVDLRGPPGALRTFQNNRADFWYLTREEIDHAIKTAKDLGTCDDDGLLSA
jgi:predicted GIY-YIG superfamily endonuclease